MRQYAPVAALLLDNHRVGVRGAGVQLVVDEAAPSGMLLIAFLFDPTCSMLLLLQMLKMVRAATSMVLSPPTAEMQ